MWRSRFIAVFVSVRKEEETKQSFEVAYLGIAEAILLKFGMWSTEVGGRVHSKNCLISSRQHRATEVRKLRFCSSCQYTHGCCSPTCFSTFYRCAMVPTLVEKSFFFVYLYTSTAT